ncbi:putative manganese ion homeostasis (Fr) [Aspergillus saccharolyticus JOP 1030-1]|uniref:Manganese ion homeostasis n=1 Tax=Aspergillus saccharolyticus JOP 1030-1 TaxID=1450539 RepID=A0A318Z991_9EURO|nr:manganese ion homeostasis [Aspergillus saccharolyticus JOP 1030-1]PYH43886.1 manganese ion homeostasis [Aspergillus saccharolyticus JOP 1030-1]
MSYSYPHSHGPSSGSYRPARQVDMKPTTISSHVRDYLPSQTQQWALETKEAFRSWSGMLSLLARVARCIFNVTNALVVLWACTLWWGERTVFQDSVKACAWETWEKWPQDASPHHVAFIADPQLVDPHTYPGRPWPLSTLTVKFTDQYMRRSFSSLQKELGPDSVLFLGDLFDGGREWATATSSSPEKRYKKYKDRFWKKEFHRFTKIFTDPWNDGDGHSSEPYGRRMITSLPGNHDLGFGAGVQIPIRERFQSFFGQGNRVDVIGNHTFVSVDTVSLSAMDQPDPETGSSGAGTGEGDLPNQRIWAETEQFLNKMNVHRGRAETESLRLMRNQSEGHLYVHRVVDILEPSFYHRPQPEIVGLPAILLTHVPLYRKPATPCGPHRERYPPSGDNLEEDDRNSIPMGRGYQYQNVLTPAISRDIVSKVGSNLVHVYSGDDHDYCEITHHEFSGSPREITVKSLSWAMGIRRPGFVMTSLWNPIDQTTGQSLQSAGSGRTLQNHLCLLPDQLSIFIYYGLVFGFTLVVLLLRAVVVVKRPAQASAPEPILPLSESHSHPPQRPARYKSPSSSTSSSTLPSPRGLASRATNNPPLYATSASADKEELGSAKWKPTRDGSGRRADRKATAAGTIRGEFVASVKQVAGIVFAWYFFLIWRW